MRIPHTLRTGVLLAVAVAIPAGVAVAAIDGGGQHLSDAARTHAATDDAQPRAGTTAGKETALESRFSVLSEPRPEANPLGSAAEYTHFADVTRAQPIPATAVAREVGSEWRTWIAPGSSAGEICVLAIQPPAVGAGGGCETLARAAEGRLIMTLGNINDGPAVLLGAMPDGVREVTLTMEDGSTQKLPVADNAYRADVTKPTRSITFTLPGSEVPTTLDALAYSG